MLMRRNGEICRHQVLGYPGLLTDSEKNAYQEAFSSVEWLLKEFSENERALNEIEKDIPLLALSVSEKTSRSTLAIRTGDNEWCVHRTLHKSSRNEILLCSRQTPDGKQFGVVEQFAHNSVYANANGDSDLQMTSNKAVLLLQDYVEQERQVLQMFKQDIEASVEETLANKFPGQDYGRVVKAISARCAGQKVGRSEQAGNEKRIQNHRIKF
jgi:hypothetical protein